ncbi:MAG: Dyp-type peroxidase, partial [Luteibacter sp.]
MTTTETASMHLSGTANLALMAPIQRGFVKGFEAITYAKRLELLFKLLNGSRALARESSLVDSPLPDLLGKHGILRMFRYAIVPASIGSEGEEPTPGSDLRPGLNRLSLNVSFDGGWEPYMRVIYRDLGPLLDTILCNCEGYPLARSNTFDAYTRWVRKHDFSGGLFYTESSMTGLDQQYLEAVERIHRNALDPADAERQIAAFALPDRPASPDPLAVFMPTPANKNPPMLSRYAKLLKLLYDMKPLYPVNERGDDQTLLRFAQSLMPEFVRFLRIATADPQKTPGAFEAFADEIEWVTRQPGHAAPTVAPEPTPGLVQAGIVNRYGDMTHGALVLMKVTNARNARAYLASMPISIEGQTPLAVSCNVAFTLQGLKALGVPPERIDKFPREFIEGMEARAGLLGDVRCNHPDHWRRPCIGGTNVEMDLGTAHVVLQWRLRDDDTPGVELHSTLKDMATEFAAEGSQRGLRVLAIEAMRSFPEPGGITREHFGFQDGFSQPKINQTVTAEQPGASWSDDVARGEVFMGYRNDRGDQRFPSQPDELMDDGTFLVVRKIRQHKDRLDAVLKAAVDQREEEFESGCESEQQRRRGDAMKAIKERMTGRDTEGVPLLQTPQPCDPKANTFNYAKDAKGLFCPFSSHVRRTNPRMHQPVPRLIRRGMSYGPRAETDPQAERGLFFMAYCGSIAEQFEIIQRWVSGGNSSGVLSSHSDPLLGVPPNEGKRIFKYLEVVKDAKGNEQEVVRRIDLGNQPFAELQWGVYLFVPSVAALKRLNAITGPTGDAARRSDPIDSQTRDFTTWKQLIEDPAERDDAWAHVRRAGVAGLQTDYGLLLGTQSAVLDVLHDEKQFSVCGYGRRLRASVGDGYLGMDGDEHASQAETPIGAGVNDAIAAISEAEGFRVALDAATAEIQMSIKLQLVPPGSEGMQLDVLDVSQFALARMCEHWFGVPGLESEDFFSVSRYVF